MLLMPAHLRLTVRLFVTWARLNRGSSGARPARAKALKRSRSKLGGWQMVGDDNLAEGE